MTRATEEGNVPSLSAEVKIKENRKIMIVFVCVGGGYKSSQSPKEGVSSSDLLEMEL